jgi:repressor LexA
MKPLTTRQTEVLACIRDYLHRHDLPPTITEIAQALNIRSPNAVRDHLHALERKGVIKLVPSTSRGIRLTDSTYKNATNQIPLIGQVAAGSPILAEQHIESYQQIDPQQFKPYADYLLRVHGMSMKKIGILDGDLLAVHRLQHAENGQIIVARIGDEVTVKRYKREKNIIYLHPENDDFETIKIDLKNADFAIEGIGVGIIRQSLLASH